MYKKLPHNRRGWYPHHSIHSNTGRAWLYTSTPLVKETDQAVQVLSQELIEAIVARPVPLSDRIDPAELLMNSKVAHSVPRSVAGQYMPVIRELRKDPTLNRPRCNLLEKSLQKAISLLMPLEKRTEAVAKTQNDV